MNHVAFLLDRHFTPFLHFLPIRYSRSFSVPLWRAPFFDFFLARWNFNQKMFVSLQETPQAPPDDTLSHQEHLDPALLSSLPRSENQYNEDFTDYARQVHNSTHGEWPVAEPYEEWACRRCHNERYWFYRAWFHHKTLPWDHEDIGYYKSATGYFIDDHPASHWPSIFSRVWGTRGWQLVLSATSSLEIWTQCERFEAALRAEEERIAAEEARLAAIQQLSHTPAPRRGQKRQALDNLEHLNVQYQIRSSFAQFLSA